MAPLSQLDLLRRAFVENWSGERLESELTRQISDRRA
jgi:hypothetical protein